MSFAPGTLMWELFCDRRGYLVSPATGLMQIMYPPLGKGVEEHSAFYEEPLERLFRSVPQIQHMIYGGDEADATAARIRDLHQGIKGAMDDGSRYHALDPETFFWAHATFIDAIYRATDLFFGKPLTREQKVAVYAEGIDWWRMYGLSMRVVPPTYDDFLDYWNHMITHELQATPAARGLVGFFQQPASMHQPWLPKPVWHTVGPALGFGYRELIVGTLPAEVREAFDMRWTRGNQRAFELFRRAVARGWPALPARARLTAEAYPAIRERGRLGLPRAWEQYDPNPRHAGTGYEQHPA